MRPMSLVFAGMFSLGVAISASQSHAGDGNMIYIKQESPAGSTAGNSLTIDQSEADNSLVHGPSAELLGLLGAVSTSQQGDDIVPFSGNLPGTTFGTQRGEGNQATLSITGSGGGELQLLQDSSPNQAVLPPAGTTSGNQATITASGAALGGVIQLGESNTADLNLSGGVGTATGLISQRGNSLSANLSVGSGGRGQIVQIGNNSDTGAVTVPPNASLAYTQVGDNLAPVGPTAVQIISSTNSGNISITQTGF
jgi:hypothetical protein